VLRPVLDPRRAPTVTETSAPLNTHSADPVTRAATINGVNTVTITEFTDPGCPWAWSAEPFRRRLTWVYGDRLQWRTCMVGLAETPQEYEDKGFTPERQAQAFASIAHAHGMPIDTEQRSRMAATLPACRAVAATRLHAPERERGILRRLRVHNFAGALLDDPQTIAAAARDAGVDPEQLRTWTEDPEVERVLRQDMDRAREPMAAARALDHKLANWSGGQRYTCPSYELDRGDGVRLAVPGFQPFATYDVLLANLIPDAPRRPAAEHVGDVLAWTGTPLATREVAEVRDIPFVQAREELGRVAVEQHVGADGLWTLAA